MHQLSWRFLLSCRVGRSNSLPPRHLQHEPLVDLLTMYRRLFLHGGCVVANLMLRDNLQRGRCFRVLGMHRRLLLSDRVWCTSHMQ